MNGCLEVMEFPFSLTRPCNRNKSQDTVRGRAYMYNKIKRGTSRNRKCFSAPHDTNIPKLQWLELCVPRPQIPPLKREESL